MTAAHISAGRWVSLSGCFERLADLAGEGDGPSRLLELLSIIKIADEQMTQTVDAGAEVTY